MTSAVISAFTAHGPKGKDYLKLSDRIPAHINSLWGVYKSLLFNENILLSLFFVAILLFGIILFIKTKQKYKKEFFFLLLFPILTYALFMGYAYPIYGPYVLGLLIPVALSFYLAMCEAWKNAFGKVLVIIFFAFTFLAVSSSLQNQYLKTYPRSDSAGSYLNQKAVVEWIYENAGSGVFGYFVYSTSTYTHGPDYLISWYHKSHPTILFESKKDVITYLILAPHMTGDNGAYDFWKKNVLHIGNEDKVLLTKTFAGGIIVEKLEIGNKEPPVDPNYYQGLLFR
jgi:hypothetical protein